MSVLGHTDIGFMTTVLHSAQTNFTSVFFYHARLPCLKTLRCYLQNEKRQLHLTWVGSGPSHLAILRWLTHIALGVVAP